MNLINFTKTELSSAVARGVRQCVVIGSRAPLLEAFKSACDRSVQMFALADECSSVAPAMLVPAQFESEPLAASLDKAGFDKLKASLFVWLGGAGYRTVETALPSLAFIASLPAGSGVVLDYAVERSAFGSLTHTALDALASRFVCASGIVKYVIQPQAVATMLRSLGFQTIVDLAQEELPGSCGRLVSATV